MKLDKGTIHKVCPNPDPEASQFLEYFDEPPGLGLLEVGAHDVPLATVLHDSGYRVTSCDLRAYDGPVRSGHRHIVGDFCDLPLPIFRDFIARFDVIVCVSALEHFGLGAYGDRPREMLDVIAARTMYQFLKPGGVCYITVPVGGRYVIDQRGWKVYDWPSLLDRVVQDFNVEVFVANITEACILDGVKLELGTSVSWEAIIRNVFGFPGISGLLKLRKPGVAK